MKTSLDRLGLIRPIVATVLAGALLAGCGSAPAPAAVPPAAAPTTAVAAAPTGAPTSATAAISDPQAAAAAKAWSTVFDSTVPVADKLPHLAEPAGAEAVLTAYAAAGTQLQGIKLQPTGATVDGDTATVTYDVLFGGNPAYKALKGTVQRAGSTWVVPKAQFCSFMAQARTPCPK